MGNHPRDMDLVGQLGNADVFGVPYFSGFLFCDGDEDIFPRDPEIDDIQGLREEINALKAEISDLKKGRDGGFIFFNSTGVESFDSLRLSIEDMKRRLDIGSV